MKLTAGFVFAAIVMAATTMMPLGARAAGIKTYKSDKYSVQVSYPDDWIDKGTSATDLLNPDYSGKENTFGIGPQLDGEILISVNDTRAQTFDEFVAALKGVIKSMGLPFKIDSSKQISVGGQPAYDVVYGGGSEFGRTRVVALFRNGKRYTIMVAGFDTKPGIYDKYAPAIDASVQSFRILN